MRVGGETRGCARGGGEERDEEPCPDKEMAIVSAGLAETLLALQVLPKRRECRGVQSVGAGRSVLDPQGKLLDATQ